MFGAVGDGLAKDTQMIQKAIDECAAKGGGTVYFPPGTYLTGTLVLRDYVTLHIEAGAVLLTSTDKEDYLIPAFYEKGLNPTTFPVLIYGKYLSHISITGRGNIVGQDKLFWTPKETIGEGWNSTPPKYWPKEWRPMMITLDGCSNVLIEGITIEQSPCYAGWLIDCERVHIRGLHVLNDFYGPNTDGLHISSCRNVHISDSHFVNGDDSIAIDGDGSGPAENFTITNCTFESSCDAFRIYTGLDPWMHNESYGVVRNISISNCSVHNAAGVINLVAKHGLIEGITVTGMTIRMAQEGTPIFILAEKGTVRNIQISQITAESDGACTIIGNPGAEIEGIRLTNIQFNIAAKKKIFGLEVPDPLEHYAEYHFVPYFIFLRHVREVSLQHVSVKWLKSELPESWPALKAIDVDYLQLEGFSGKQKGEEPAMPAVWLEDVKEAHVIGCRALRGTDSFLYVTGSQTESILLSNNDFRHAGSAYTLDSKTGVTGKVIQMSGK
ncbi:glycoside hydrolase family 28 protein [Paenibacillus eucommiae]